MLEPDFKHDFKYDRSETANVFLCSTWGEKKNYSDKRQHLFVKVSHVDGITHLII